MSILEYLYFAGDDRFGALGVSSSSERYAPRPPTLLPTLTEVGQVHAVVRKVEAGEPLDERERKLISPGRTMGGARPKALVEIDGEQWVLKFSEAGEEFDVLGYPQLARLLRRRGDADSAVREADRQELFRRMIFNLMIDNTDDHEKNHALLASDANTYRLAPAYDVVPAGTALSGCAAFGLKRDEAAAQAKHVADVVDGWQAHFRRVGVTPADIDRLATWIDGPHLRAQRAEIAPLTPTGTPKRKRRS